MDVTITQHLKNEGIARELVNRIQNLRKDSGFEVTDRIYVQIEKHAVLEDAIAANMDYIKRETLTDELQFEDSLSNGTEIAFDDIVTKLHIKK